MSTTPADEATPARVPVVTLGPCGTGFMSVDPTVEEALSHLQSHRMTDPASGGYGSMAAGGDESSAAGSDEPKAAGDDEPAAALPRVAALSFYDGGARAMRLELDGPVARLVVADDQDRSGELRARIDETFAHARHRAYRDPTLLRGSKVQSPEMLRPPDDEALEDYLDALCRRLSFQMPVGVAEHVGSWWHNLFHRL